MGNFMIGDFYPPFLGRVEKIMCGTEQCWPNKNSRRWKWFVLMDNPIDKNVLAKTAIGAGVTVPQDELIYEGHAWIYYVPSYVPTPRGIDTTTSFWKRNLDDSLVYIGAFTHHAYFNPEESWWDDASTVYLYVNPLEEFNFKTTITYKNQYGTILKHENIYHLAKDGTIRISDGFVERNWSSYKPGIGGLPAGFFTSGGYVITGGSVSEQWPGNMGSTFMDGNYELYPDLSVCDEDAVKADVVWTVREGTTDELYTELYETNEYTMPIISKPVYATEITSEGTFTFWEDFRYGDVGKYTVERVGDYYRVLFYGYNSISQKCDIYIGERRCTYELDSSKQVWYENTKITHYLREIVPPEPPSPSDTKVTLYIQDHLNGWEIIDTYDIAAAPLWESLPMGHSVNPYMYYYDGRLMLEGDFTRYIDDFGKEMIEVRFYTYDYSLTPVGKNPSYVLSIKNDTGTPYWAVNHAMYAII